jgi:hypothetical protein
MCEPATIAMVGVGISAASTAAKFQSDSQDASDAAKVQNKRYTGVAGSAMDSYFRGLNSIAQRSEQETAGASQAAQEVVTQAREATGTATAGAAARGVGGNSVTALLHEFASLEDDNLHTINTNLMWSKTQLGAEAEAIAANTQSRIASAAPSRVRGPSAPAAILGFAGSAMQWGAWSADHPPSTTASSNFGTPSAGGFDYPLSDMELV